MDLTTSLLFYLLFGGAVAVAIYLASADRSPAQQWFRTLTAVVFWPLYVPVVLQRPASRPNETVQPMEPGGSPLDVAGDDLAMAIHQVETELDLALVSLGGWSDAVLDREQHRFEELRVAWHAQAAKIREMDHLVSQLLVPEASAGPLVSDGSERMVNSQRAREANIVRLRTLRDRYRADLMNTLAWVRELVTMIHLAKYTGAPASRAEELVMQIATSIEGLSEVAAWRDADSAEKTDATAAA